MLQVNTGRNSSIGDAAGRYSSVTSGAGHEALYTREGVIQHFEAVMDTLELKQQIAELDSGMNSFFTRKRSLAEFTAMCVGLWKLALERSFPNEAEDFFREFTERSKLLGKGKKRARMLELVNSYNELFAVKKTEDFSGISQYMADSLGSPNADRKTLQLRLSLTIRKIYQTIFDHLI